MKIKSLSLKGFRNYNKQVFELSDNTSLVVGKNGSGKTNALEAIHLLATGVSFRAKKSTEMIFYGQELARVSGDVSSDGLEVVLTVGEVQGDKVPKKRYLVNGVVKRKMDFIGKLRVVLFRPEDIELVLGSPSIRRDYFDRVLEQADREYRRSNLSYQKGVRQRNKLLFRIREGEADRQQLLFWNKLLLKNGEIVSQKREEFLNYVNQKLEEKGLDLSLEYDRSVISEARLDQYAAAEVAAATTLVGPHRDDFLFIKQREGKLKKDLSVYGSRGEQRMAVFQIKLAELEYAQHSLGKPVKKLESKGYSSSTAINNEERPVLLLDDVFSELDKSKRREVFKLLNKQQTIITTSDVSLMPKRYLKKVEIVRL